MPLLHTWSLGVEEQFYLVWPALLLGLSFLFGRSRRWTVGVLVVVAVLSFCASVVLTSSDPKAAFYLPHTRAWEFCVGASLSLIGIKAIELSRRLNEIAVTLGILLIAVAALFYTVSTPFPGYAAIVPVIGAALIIAPFTHIGSVRNALSAAPCKFIGKISYSLYLWHWPIITLYRHYNLGRHPTFTEAVWLLLVIFAVSWFSWRFIEEPFRRRQTSVMGTLVKASITATILLVASTAIIAFDGLPGRLSASAAPYRSLRIMTRWQCPQERNIHELGRVCVLGARWETAKVRGILIGDSHAEHLSPILDIAARQAGIALIRPFWICMPLIGTTSVKRYDPKLPRYNRTCSNLYKPILSYVRGNDDIQIVVVAAAWAYYKLYRDGPARQTSGKRSLKLTELGIDELGKQVGLGHNRKMIVIADVAGRMNIDLSCLNHGRLPLRPQCPSEMFLTPNNAKTRRVQQSFNSMIRELPAHHPNIIDVIPQDAQCDEKGCRTMVNGEFIYRDAGHLRMNLLPATLAKLSREFHLKQALEMAETDRYRSVSAPHQSTQAAGKL
jgi:hypothetical protein